MKKPLLLTLLLFITTLTAFSQFITTWKTDNAGTSQSDQIQLPIYGDGYEIYWWLKSDSTGVNGTAVASGNNYTLTLPHAGVYGVSISKGNGTLNNFRFGNAGDRLKLLEINQWGNHAWTSMQAAFYGCSNLTISALDIPNLTQVRDLSNTFTHCSKIELIPLMENWDVSNVTNMGAMFYGSSLFNQHLDNWDVSKVTNMAGMFTSASSFNQPLDNWDVGQVINMHDMFHLASLFNQPLNNWDVGQVTNMIGMFHGASLFNQDLFDWDVSKVTDMGFMFFGASKFDQSLDKWVVSNVTNMYATFNGATSFNQPLNNWDVSKVTSMVGMFGSASKFNEPLDNWDVSKVTNMSYMFTGASQFNQPLDIWNVGQVINMHDMFYRASSFNQPLNNWDVGKVTDMIGMFHEATLFNQSLDDWDVNSVTDFGWMFVNASSFNQPLNDWNVGKVASMSNMFNLSGIDCANITHTLQGWADNPLTPNNINLGAFGINYANEANDALNTLRNDKGWSINIGSEIACQQLPVTLVHFKAVQQEDGVYLDWATSLEQDHDYFEVQRSVDSKNWLPLTGIQGSGNGNALHDYAYVDIHPLQATSYYRLKMVDLDGTIAYSTIRSVNRGNISTVKVYPNPTSATLTLSGLPKGMLKIYNRLGFLVGQQYITPQETTFSVAQLPAGVYILKMEHGWQHQLVKVN